MEASIRANLVLRVLRRHPIKVAVGMVPPRELRLHGLIVPGSACDARRVEELLASGVSFALLIRPSNQLSGLGWPLSALLTHRFPPVRSVPLRALHLLAQSRS